MFYIEHFGLVITAEFLTIPEMRARGLVCSLWALKLSHSDRSLVTVTSVAMSSLALTVKSVLQIPCTVALKWREGMSVC